LHLGGLVEREEASARRLQLGDQRGIDAMPRDIEEAVGTARLADPAGDVGSIRRAVAPARRRR